MEEQVYYLAVDIGASSGRHILAHLQDGRIHTEEIYRFANGMDDEDGHRVWDTGRLFSEVLSGMRACKELGKIPVSMGIDTWGVDYVLLDGEDRILGKTYAYRDARTDGADEEVYRLIPERTLYEKTGIQKAIFNTIFQLTAQKKQEPETLSRAEALLMIPDYLHFLLTGVKTQEYTNATTTGLVNAEQKTWDMELIRLLGLPEKLFSPLRMPGETVGMLTPEIREKVGFDCKVILPATHDTGSAVMSVPSEEADTLYISSGTWSLLGCERETADCSEEAQRANFTNEGGYAGRYRFLKNIMGLWMIQSVRNELKDADRTYSFAELCTAAEEAKTDALVDVGDDRFLVPDSMIKEVQETVREQGKTAPETPGELARVIYRSLASCYGSAVRELEHITGKSYETLHIVGGGSNAEYLNRLTAEATGKRVLAGPAEATAIGNLGAQMLADHVFQDLGEFRRVVRESFLQ